MLILGAHYDTVENTPGADDNASGVAALLGIAQDLAGRRLARTVRFSAFALEELPVYRTHHMGSYHYARMLKQTGAAVEGMICLEMVGYFTDLPGSQSYPLPIFKLKYPSRGNLSRWSGTRGPGHLRKGWLQECAQRSTCLS
jgi:Zn-dependent M28 family amino/carboxypeptidase